MDELLDLVNENDEVIGEVWKSEANSNPKLIHREILIYVFDDQNRMLMQQRSFNKKVYPGQWAETCAGHIGKGEDPEKAAYRELFEELGLKIKLKFIKKRLINQKNETHFAFCYVGRYDGSKIIIDKNEVEQAKFVAKDKFEELFRAGGDEFIEGEIEWMKEIWKK